MSSLQTIKALISSVQGNELPQPYGVVQLSPQNNFRAFLWPQETARPMCCHSVSWGWGLLKLPRWFQLRPKLRTTDELLCETVTGEDLGQW